MKSNYKHQGGWVASFLIVGVLLTLAVLGGLYYVKSNQKQLAGTKNVATESTNKEAEPSKDISPTVTPQSDAPQQKGETVDTNKTQPSTTTPAAPSDTTTKNTPSQSTPNSTTPPTGTSSTPQSTVPSSGSAASKLPATGPEDTLLNACILAIVAFAAATYVRSRNIAQQ